MKSSYMIKRILSAKVYDVAVETPIDTMDSLSRRLHNTVLIKREDLQRGFSFKVRGAHNKISLLSPSERTQGIIAASAGNHAQGVALSARVHKTEATIVMPVTTPAIKVQSVKALGERWVTVDLHGDRYDDACAHAHMLAKQSEAVFIHAYDDLDVIAGQGTIGLEILRQCAEPPHVVFVPVGGGGLIAGISTYIKYLQPEVKIIGVEAEDSACLKAALEAHERVRLPHVGIFADGVAVAQIGEAPFELIEHTVDDAITVSNDEICAAIKYCFDDTRAIVEPAGALSLAGLVKYVQREQCREHILLAINTGANVNFDRLRYVSERYGIGQQSEAMFGITIPEAPGSLRALCAALGSFDITEFNYRHNEHRQAHVFVGVKLNEPGDRERITQSLTKQGYELVDLSGNELAKLHICHMIGGCPTLDERIFRFEFPERAGILDEFLTVMRGRWNVSLFHYRQHGGTYANVLIGLQAIPGQDNDIKDFQEEWPYPCVEETDNKAYQMFLRS